MYACECTQCVYLHLCACAYDYMWLHPRMCFLHNYYRLVNWPLMKGGLLILEEGLDIILLISAKDWLYMMIYRCV